jgi:hypothetical protein
MFNYFNLGRAGSINNANLKLNRIQQKQSEALLLQAQKKSKTGNDVIIHLPSTQTVTFSVKDTTTVSELKDMIFEKTSIAVKEQKLLFDGIQKKNNSIVPPGCEVIMHKK